MAVVARKMSASQGKGVDCNFYCKDCEGGFSLPPGAKAKCCPLCLSRNFVEKLPSPVPNESSVDELGAFKKPSEFTQPSEQTQTEEAEDDEEDKPSPVAALVKQYENTSSSTTAEKSDKSDTVRQKEDSARVSSYKSAFMCGL